jgi:hypothetical protein
MADELTAQQISLLFEVGEEEAFSYSGDKKRDFEHLLATGYVERSTGGPKYKLTAKGEHVIEERGGGINEA